MATQLKFALKVADKGWKQIKALALQVKQHHNKAKAGVLAPSHHDAEHHGHGGAPHGKKTHERHGDLTNVEIALIHEFGSPAMGIPERSFVRSSFRNHRPEYIGMLKKMMPAVYRNKLSVNKMLAVVGAVMASDMKRGITDGAGIPPPLKAETIAAKGSDRPLIDSGQLVNSITWAVQEGGD